MKLLIVSISIINLVIWGYGIRSKRNKTIQTIQSAFRKNRAMQTLKEKRKLEVNNNSKGSFPLVFVPTPIEAIDLFSSKLKEEEEILIDFGSGDGRVLLEVVKRTKYLKLLYGMELNENLINKANEKKKILGNDEWEKKIFFFQIDFFKEDSIQLLSENKNKTLVIFMYLLPEIQSKLCEFLKARLKKQTRIFTYTFPITELNSVNKYLVPKTPQLYLYEYVL